MGKCHRCKVDTPKSAMLGANVFDAVAGTHIITRWYCLFCAKAMGLISNE